MATTSTSRTTFKPFVPAHETRPELSARALLLGAFFGILFGAVTVYVGLRAGLTVAASIPISVLSISILRAFGKASILENNIVQTTGNAGQSIASGRHLHPARPHLPRLRPGVHPHLRPRPLRRLARRPLHDPPPQTAHRRTSTTPSSTPKAPPAPTSSMAGERGGSFASRVFFGLGLGALYTLFQNDNIFALWPSTPNYSFDLGPQHLLKGGSAIRADVTPEYLGVGYIIGIRVAAVMLAGGVFSWLVLMPAIYFFGSHLTHPPLPRHHPSSAT